MPASRAGVGALATSTSGRIPHVMGKLRHRCPKVPGAAMCARRACPIPQTPGLAPIGIVLAESRAANHGGRSIVSTMRTVVSHVVDGHVSHGFEAVRDAFEENFERHGELGGACCAYHRGEKVVDLWGGIRDKATGARWERDTMVVVHSATKGLAAMTLALAHSRGWLDYEERVATYWPEFAQQGKQDITVRQLLAHQAGLFAFDEPVDRDVIADLDRLAEVMARQNAGVGAGDAAGVSRTHARVLRGRVDAPHRPRSPHTGAVLPRRDRRGARRGGPYRSAGGGSEFPPGRSGPARAPLAAAGVSASTDPGGH